MKVTWTNTFEIDFNLDRAQYYYESKMEYNPNSDPDKLIYDVALRKMNGNPEKSVMVGNKFKEDALGAVNAGLSAILVNSDITEEDRDYIKKEKLDITIIQNIGDIKTIL